MEAVWDILLKSDAPVLVAALIYVYRQMIYWRKRHRALTKEYDQFRTAQLDQWQQMYEAANSALKVRQSKTNGSDG